ncbi:MAG TPA: DUF4232 domain-containing protein [Pseudonocardiaceae bacterium]|nr:DUF4232 domain-containing protein [Pseudonocardiaceae bacterium]
MRRLVGVVLLMLVVAGCGAGQSAAPVVSTTVVPTTTSAAPTSARPTSPRPVPVAVVSVRAELNMQGGALGLLALTNTGKQSVTVQGWPAMKFLDAANGTLSVPVQRVAVPGAGPSIRLAPGRTAFAGVTWVVGDKAETDTYVATTVRLTPPGAGAPVVVSVVGTDGRVSGYPELDLKSVKVGTWQPASQGVLAF